MVVVIHRVRDSDSDSMVLLSIFNCDTSDHNHDFCINVTNRNPRQAAMGVDTAVDINVT